MEMYGGYGAYNVGPVATLRACLDEPGAKDENRMQCIQMLSFSQYMPYEEALYLTPALPLPNASTRLGTCHALSYGSRTSTGATGLAIDMIEDDDLLHLAAAAAERAPIRPLVQWCSKVVHPDASFALNHKRWLACIGPAAGGVARARAPHAVRTATCEQLLHATWTADTATLKAGYDACMHGMATGCVGPLNETNFYQSKELCVVPTTYCGDGCHELIYAD